jgi:hypothetical protein
MIKPKRSAEQQVADELERRALHPLSSRQTISDSQAEPEFHANQKRLRAERLAREAVEIELKAKPKADRSTTAELTVGSPGVHCSSSI